jgi:hypothetical protein
MLFAAKSMKSSTLVRGTRHTLRMVHPSMSVLGMFEAHCHDYGVVAYGKTKNEADKALARLLGV